jgi:hypothetical protein
MTLPTLASQFDINDIFNITSDILALLPLPKSSKIPLTPN